MTYIMVDIEADGPVPGIYSMIGIGAVVVEPNLSNKFHGLLKPISVRYEISALNAIKMTREETLKFDDAEKVMLNFDNWVNKYERPMFISDNNGFDWQFVNWYFHNFLGYNPFGFSSTNLGSLYKGMVLDMRKNFKHLRKTKHTHNPLDDAMGNAEAFLEMQNLGLNI